MKTMLFRCPVCGNVIMKVIDGGVIPSCCGKQMEELHANVSDGKSEYHVPVVECEHDNKAKIRIGKDLHPMSADHYIQFVCVETCCSMQIHFFKPDDKPQIELCADCRITAVYAYCNIHGLWKTCMKEC